MSGTSKTGAVNANINSGYYVLAPKKEDVSKKYSLYTDPKAVKKTSTVNANGIIEFHSETKNLNGGKKIETNNLAGLHAVTNYNSVGQILSKNIKDPSRLAQGLAADKVVTEYDPATGKLKHERDYYPNGRLHYAFENNTKTGQMVADSLYDEAPDEAKYSRITKYDNKTGNALYQEYKGDFGVCKTKMEYTQNGQLKKRIEDTPEGSSVMEYYTDPKAEGYSLKRNVVYNTAGQKVKEESRTKDGDLLKSTFYHNGLLVEKTVRTDKNTLHREAYDDFGKKIYEQNY